MSKHALTALALLFLTGCVDDGWYTEMDPARLIDQMASDGMPITDEVTIPGEMDGYSDPFQVVIPDGEARFDALPLDGALDRQPWSDSYWPENQGGIAYRWQRDEAHDYPLLAKHEIREMPPAAVAQLSPAEKYDLFVGNYEYPLTQRVRSETSPDEAGWTGYCHGWAPASMHHAEPQPITVVNPDGIEIPFGSSDLKALLTYFDGEVVQTTWGPYALPFGRNPVGIGSTCGSGRMVDPACFDVNPGGLHAMLGNLVGIDKTGFVLEVDPAHEKWNQPVYAYRAAELGRRAPSVGAADEAVEERIVRTEVTWGQEIEPMWEPVVGTHHQSMTTRAYLYSVELNAGGEIVGGQWLYEAPNGDYLTLNTVYHWLRQADQDGDGTLDYTLNQASDVLRQVVNIADYAWIVEPSELPTEFADVYTYWELQGGGVTTTKRLHKYFGRLPELL
jgi:hypothetical protein